MDLWNQIQKPRVDRRTTYLTAKGKDDLPNGTFKNYITFYWQSTKLNNLIH